MADPKPVYVEIVQYVGCRPELVVKRMGPMSPWKADKVDSGANINLDHDRYYTRIVETITRSVQAGGGPT